MSKNDTIMGVLILTNYSLTLTNYLLTLTNYLLKSKGPADGFSIALFDILCSPLSA